MGESTLRRSGHRAATLHLRFDLQAAHSLPHLPSQHKCSHVHGHRYGVEVELHGPVDPDTGWIIDYAVVDEIWREAVHDVLDHQMINRDERVEGSRDLLGDGVASTCENLAHWIFHALRSRLASLDLPQSRGAGGRRAVNGGLVRTVTVYETARFGASYP